MRNIVTFVAGSAFAALLLLAGALFAAPVGTSEVESARLTRAPFYASGAWTALNPTAAAAASTAALTVNARYVLQCNDDTYLRFGTAASGQDATSSNGWIPAGAWLEFSVDSVQYVSALNKNVDSICYLLEAR